MNLQELIEWTKQAQSKEELKKLVRKDPKTNLPRDGDILICYNMLGEIRARANKVIFHTKESEKYMSNISEYLTTLDQRGVSCPFVKKEEDPSASAAPTSNKKAASK